LGEGFGKRNDIRGNAGVLVAKPAPGSADAGLNLIGHEQPVMCIG